MSRVFLAGDTGCVVDNVSVVSTKVASNALKDAYYANIGKLLTVNPSGLVDVYADGSTISGVLTNHGVSNDCVTVASKDTAISIISDVAITSADIGKPLYATATGTFTLTEPVVGAAIVAYVLSESKEVDSINIALVRLSLSM